MYQGKIPFYRGEVLHYVNKPMVDWEENRKFKATITLTGRVRSGRSAKNIPVIIESDMFGTVMGTIFVRDFVDAVIEVGMRPGGEMSGKWVFCKRGQNYGVQLATD